MFYCIVNNSISLNKKNLFNIEILIDLNNT